MSQRQPTLLEYALLGLIHQEPQSGYDLRKIFESTALASYSGSPGAIYPALRRLEVRGLIVGEVDSTIALRPKKLFRPTSEGSQVLRRWLAATIVREDVERRIDELMLRFAFHWLLDDPAETRQFLISLRAEVADYVEELQSQARSIPAEAPVHPRLALEAGIAQYQAWEGWARQALKSFKEKE